MKHGVTEDELLCKAILNHTEAFVDSDKDFSCVYTDFEVTVIH